jgi:hypothetical protein
MQETSSCAQEIRGLGSDVGKFVANLILSPIFLQGSKANREIAFSKTIKFTTMTTKTLFEIILLCSMLIISCKNGPQSNCDCEKLKFPSSRYHIIGAESELLTGNDAGLPLDSLPGAKTISSEELNHWSKSPETGLFLLDMDYVPQELKDELKEEGYSLSKDGTLDSSGVRITLIVQNEVYRLSNKTQATNTTINRLATQPNISLASPLPFAGFSKSFWWKYNGGFCRSYEAKSRAYTYGPKVDGIWPSTNVELIQTHVDISSGGKSDTDVCNNCSEEGSSVKNKIGCWWPAHGKGFGSHYIYIFDSGISISRSWGWSH